jgi:MYXO-CTERM domain-containing protein
VYFDGAVLEASGDDGMTWIDIGSSASPGYNGSIVSGANALGGRNAYVGTSSGFPATWQTVTVNANVATLRNKSNVRVRLRTATDENTALSGWQVDDFSFTVGNTPFTEVRPDLGGGCVAVAPTAEAGADFTADERSTVVLPAEVFDANGEPVTIQWTAPAGITLSSTDTAQPRFDAPEVTVDTPYTFSVLVRDPGGLTATDSVTVTVRNVNRKPIATIARVETVESGDEVVLDGTRSADPDGDEVSSYAWEQTTGPAVTLDPPNGTSARFVAPEVTTGTPLRFTLEVRDGTLSSEKATIEVLVVPRGSFVGVGCGCGTSSSSAAGLVGLLLALGAWARRGRSRSAGRLR